VRGDCVSETLAGFVLTSKALISVQLPKTLPLKDLVVVSGYSLWQTTPPSYAKVGARGIILSFLASPGFSRTTKNLHLTATSSS
jgi:hypothetical protein